MRYEFHPDALAEYRDAAMYYAERRKGLELRFIECVESAIQRILQSPSACKILEEDVRYCTTPVFPYSVLFTIEPEYILIIGIAHHRRKPRYWKYRYIRS